MCSVARGPLALCSAQARLQAWTGCHPCGDPARRHCCRIGRRSAEGRGQDQGIAGCWEEGPGVCVERRCVLNLAGPRGPAAAD